MPSTIKQLLKLTKVRDRLMSSVAGVQKQIEKCNKTLYSQMTKKPTKKKKQKKTSTKKTTTSPRLSRSDVRRWNRFAQFEGS